MIVWKFIQYRLTELFVWLGIPIIGVFFSGKKPELMSLTVFLLATAFLISHTLLLNDWTGQKINPAEIKRVTLRAGESKNTLPLAIASVIFLLFSIMLFASLEIRLLIPLTCWVVLSFLYSHPVTHMKANAGSSFILHLLGGVVKFLLGYLLLSNDFQKGLMLGLFFSMVFSAGSLVHQCLHESEDKEAGLDTAAVQYGGSNVLKLAVLLFLLSQAYLMLLALWGWLGWKVALLFSIPLIAHLRILPKLFLKSKNTEKIARNYQQLYRVLFGGATLAVILRAVIL